MSLYGECTALFSHCRPVDEATISKLEVEGLVETFMTACRDIVVSKKLGHITPKLHMLEVHVVPSIRRRGVGLGLLAEQGSESIHARFNELRRHHEAIRNPLERLKSVAQTHLIATLPQHESLRPVSRKRKSSQ